MFYFCLKELITWYTHLTHSKTARFLLKKISYTYPKNTIIQTKNIFQMHEKKTIYLPRTSKKYWQPEQAINHDKDKTSKHHT